MEMAKPTESEKERFRSLFAELPGAEIKPMFGNLGAFVNGNLFAGLYGSTVGLRLSETDRDELIKSSATVPFGPAEKPMASYVGLPLEDQPDIIRSWGARALANVRTMPPKPAKTPKSKKG